MIDVGTKKSRDAAGFSCYHKTINKWLLLHSN